MDRIVPTLILFAAQLISPTLPQQDPVQDLQSLQFIEEAKQFHDAYNKLMDGANNNVWDVKLANKVPDLFKTLTKNPNWKVR